MSRAKALLFAVLVAAASVCAVGAIWRVREARRALIDALRHMGESSMALYQAFPMAEREAPRLVVAGLFLAGLSLMALLAGVVKARRGWKALSWGPVVVATSMLAVAGGAVALGAFRFATYSEGCVDPRAIEPIRYEAFAAGALPHDVARGAVVAALVLSTAWIVRTARRADSSSSPRMFAPVVLFVVGLGAFAATRAEGHDARHPPPLLPTSWRAFMGYPAMSDLPPAAGCEPGVGFAPMLSAGPKWVLLDGVDVRADGALAEAFGKERALWMQVQPNKPFPAQVEVAFVASMPMAEARGLLEKLSAAGARTMFLVETVPNPPLATRTLGELGYLPRGCRVPLPAVAELPSTGTWGDLARALAR